MIDCLEIEKSKVLVLGGSGFIGKNLCQTLASVGDSVTSLSLSPTNIQGVVDVCASYFDDHVLESEISRHDVIIHLVSTSVPSTADINVVKDVEENLLRTIKILDLCVAKKVKKFIFISSGGTVYGHTSQQPIKESADKRPINAYGTCKLSIENYIDYYSRVYDLDSVILRVANPYGPFQTTRKAQGAVAHFINNILTSANINIWGDGELIRDYIYIDDVVDAILKATNYSGEHRVFNIGTGNGTSLNQLVRALEHLSEISVNVSYTNSRKIDVTYNVLDCELAKKELNWQAKTSLFVGLKKTLEKAKNEKS